METIAILGKGGVGKTTLSALLVRILSSDKTKRVLAIDADPAVGLSTALGVRVDQTLDDIRVKATESTTARLNADSLLEKLEYELSKTLVNGYPFSFLAIGRPEKEGCYCAINEFLKLAIAELMPNFDYIVIDGEAGIEQLNRRVMDDVSHIVLVSDSSKKGLNVASTIYDIAKDDVNPNNIGLIVNRHHQGDKIAYPENMKVIGFLKDSKKIRDADIEGEPITSELDKNFYEKYKRMMLDFLSDK